MFCNQARALFPVLEIRRLACARTEGLRRRVDADEDDVGVFDSLHYVGGEKEVASAGLLDDIVQSGFVNRHGF